MAASRRDFLRRTCAGAAAWNALGLAPGATRACELAVEMDTDERARLAAFALEMARKEGATYADIRINRYRNQMISFRAQTDRATRKPVEVPRVADSESFGFGIRVLAEGTWGFASSYDVSKDAIARAAAHAVEIAKANASLRRRPVQLAATPAYKDSTALPIAVDPFSVPIEQKLDLLRAVAAEALAVKGVFSINAFILQRSEDRFFASSEGSVIQQLVYQVGPEFTAQAVEAGRKVKSRTYRPNAVCAGYEAVERAKLVENARRVGEQAVEHLKAPSVSPGVKDLVLLPTHLGLTIHESIGHSTELDRALGYEANYAGTSFLTPEKLGKFRGRLGDRQLLRRPHPAREPLDLRLRRRRGQDAAVPDHQGRHLRRVPDHPRPGPLDRPERVDGLLLRRLVFVDPVSADAQRLAGSLSRGQRRWKT